MFERCSCIDKKIVVHITDGNDNKNTVFVLVIGFKKEFVFIEIKFPQIFQ